MPKLEIPETLDTLEGVPEQFHSLYMKKEDGSGYAYKDPKAALESMRRAKEERGELAEKVKDFETRYKDVDPEEYRSLKAKAKDFDDIEKVQKGELDKIKSELRDKYEGQITAAKQQIIERDARYANSILEGRISSALEKAGATKKGAEVLGRVLRADITTKMGDNGEPEFYILDSKGKQRLNENADPFTIDDLIAEQREDLPQLFGSSAGSGSGSGQQDRNVQVPSDESPSTWNDQQRKAYINQHGQERYRALVIKEGQKRDEDRRNQRRKTA